MGGYGKSFDEDNSNDHKSSSGWKLLSIFALITALISLFGIWYVNNEKAFLRIENNKLSMEIETLKEEIEILQDSLAQDNNPVEKDNDNRETIETENNEAEDNNNQENDIKGNETENDEAEDNDLNYVIKPGDSLIGISISMYGTDAYASQIAELNGLTAESILQVGQTIKLPDKNN